MSIASPVESVPKDSLTIPSGYFGVLLQLTARPAKRIAAAANVSNDFFFIDSNFLSINNNSKDAIKLQFLKNS